MKEKIDEFMEKIDEFLEWGGTKKNILLLIIGGISVIISLMSGELGLFTLPVDPAWIAIIVCGIPIVLEALVGLITEFDIKADVLVAIALIASICTGEIFAAGEVAVIMQLGELLEDLTVDRARAGIEKLVKLTPTTARVLSNGTECEVDAASVQVGQLLRVLPGETVPVDGIITEGQTSINQAVMTGESLPVDKSAGDTVSSGTLNQFGAFTMKATKVGEDSSIQRMIKLVQSADAGKAKIAGLADRWATWVVVAAVTAAIVTGLVSGELTRAVTILVVFCPCALVLATPTAIMAAIGNATKHGFLVKEGDALERLAAADTITFDKTGTLTYGKPQVVAVCPTGTDIDKDELYRLIASAESGSEHPLGKAVTGGYEGELLEISDFEMQPGMGISAVAGGRRILAGNLKLLEKNGCKMNPTAGDDAASEYLGKGCTLIYAAVDGKYAGFLALSDTLRREASGCICQLKNMGVKPVLLTGDNEKAAGYIAGEVGIEEYKAACLPENKLEYVKDAEAAGSSVCMMGDGINDAPALRAARVSIAMGAVGSDIAIEAADIALVDDEVKELPHLMALSRHMMKIIKINLTVSMTINFIAVGLAAAGLLGPVLGALVHNAGSVLVIGNSALLLGWKRK